MHRKSCFIVLGVLLALVFIVPVLAQDASSWFVYLYNTQTKDLVRVNADGSQATYNLGVGSDVYMSSYDMAFTSDGTLTAFCTSVNSGDRPESMSRLIVRNVIAQSDVLNLDMGANYGCRVGRFGFNAEGTQVAVGIVRAFPFDPSMPEPSGVIPGPAWELLVYDLTGSQVQTINAASPTAATLGADMGGVFMPIVQYFANNQIIFGEMFWGGEGSFEMSTHLWNLSDSSVAPIEHWGQPGVDSLSTGELIWINDDANLPAAVPMGPFGMFNVLMLADKSGQARMIYHSPDWTLADARFINDGQQIAILLLPGFDESLQPEEFPPSKWVVLDRAGAISDLYSSIYYTQLEAAPGGYVVLDATYQTADNSTSLFTLQYNNGSAITQIWTFGTQDPSVYWELAWSAPTATVEGLPPFPTFAV